MTSSSAALPFLAVLLAAVAHGSSKEFRVHPRLPKLMDGTEPLEAHVAEVDGVLELRAGLVADSDSPPFLAWGSYERTFNATGWATLEVHTNSSYDDFTQMFAAGGWEGAMTYQSIWDTYVNRNLSAYCDGQQAYCDRLTNFIKENNEFAESSAAQAGTQGQDTAYWHQYKLIVAYLTSMMQGYNMMANAMKDGAGSLTLTDFLMLSYISDVDALETTLHRGKRSEAIGSGSCSAIVKIIGDNEDVLFTHDTWTHFSTMLRIYKYYDFAVTTDGKPGSPRIPGRKVSFSSYPGFMHSNDDFYTLGTGLAVMETTIGNNNAELFQRITPKSIFYFYRIQIANRLATKGAEWAEIFSRFNSGTYNNQWMVFDYNRFTPGSAPRSGAFTVLEQIPTYIHTEDMTEFLNTHRHWPSYNLPFFKSVFALGDFQSMVDKYGDFFSFELAPRAQIFKRDHAKVTDIESLKRLMRYNDFEHDPLARCKCTPYPYSGENAIAARSDLNPANGTYPIQSLGHRMHGATDCKITTSAMMRKLQALAISGPTNDQQPTFKWSTSGAARPRSHPDIFDHDFTVISWTDV